MTAWAEVPAIRLDKVSTHSFLPPIHSDETIVRAITVAVGRAAWSVSSLVSLGNPSHRQARLSTRVLKNAMPHGGDSLMETSEEVMASRERPSGRVVMCGAVRCGSGIADGVWSLVAPFYMKRHTLEAILAAARGRDGIVLQVENAVVKQSARIGQGWTARS